MKKILVIEDDPEVLKKLLGLLLPQERGEVFEPEWLVTICTFEDVAKFMNPSWFDFVLIDHDLPDRGNGGRILNYWFMEYESAYFPKIIAISAVPVNNARLINLGANISIEKMKPDFIEKLKEELGIK